MKDLRAYDWTSQSTSLAVEAFVDAVAVPQHQCLECINLPVSVKSMEGGRRGGALFRQSDRKQSFVWSWRL